MLKVGQQPEVPVGTGRQAVFRLDNEYLAFRFTATLSDRYGVSIERLTTPDRLDTWLVVNGLLNGVGDSGSTIGQLWGASLLREAIHRSGSALAAGGQPTSVDLEQINVAVRDARLVPQLDPTGLSWSGTGHDPVVKALGRVAQDAVMLLGGLYGSGEVKTCSNPVCRGLFVDTSRAGNRRWCSMNICGNREKKQRHRGPRASAASEPPPRPGR